MSSGTSSDTKRTSFPLSRESISLPSRPGNTLSGYATTARGEHLLFSILGNNNNLHAQDANKTIDAIAVAMVEELGTGTDQKK